MRKRFILFIALLGMPALLFGAEPIRVFVTILPEQTFVERVGGPHVAVEALVRPGFSPHAYEPTPNQITHLAKADVYFGIGLPFESAWKTRIRAVNPEIHFVDLSEGIRHRQLEAHDDDPRDAHADHHDHASSEQDPHLWTSPPLVIDMAERIAATLAAIDPAHAADYAARLAGFKAELDQLDHDIRAELAGLSHRRFMVYHPAWGYFADTYGLTQIPIEAEGKEPGPQQLTTLIDQARREDVRVIFVQPQFAKKAAEQIAREIGGRVEVVDNLAPDYIATMRKVAALIASANR
ncbi:metal ABC transporter solute-binding protein, Zn/Mn family [Thiocystis violacea]|uniref:metal ABC transporter solute-binding protein, Zn/Mn family n=1 Tax=Thiocystis violacea TaxID=13725 RepID=UPI0019069152|nr:zinc ABC transporter substrate-binding protein [Thiocystis violacea]MBK1720861.1 ABC transporter substrate-binding protein [Thiocystis violacea]